MVEAEGDGLETSRQKPPDAGSARVNSSRNSRRVPFRAAGSHHSTLERLAKNSRRGSFACSSDATRATTNCHPDQVLADAWSRQQMASPAAGHNGPDFLQVRKLRWTCTQPSFRYLNQALHP